MCARPGAVPDALVLPERAHYEALQQARSVISSEAGAGEYRRRAGIEGSLSQGVRRSDLRHARYIGLAKTHLQNVATATGLNVLRAINHLERRAAGPDPPVPVRPAAGLISPTVSGVFGTIQSCP